MKANRIYVKLLLLELLALVILWAGVRVGWAEPEIDPDRPTVTYYVNVDKGSALNVRLEPVMGAEIAVRMERGETVEAYEIADGWALVKYAGEYPYGYVYAAYLCDKPPGEDAIPMTVRSEGRVRIRDAPEGKTTGRYAHNGDVVSVSATCADWAKIKSGWVQLRYLTEDQPERGDEP